MNKNTNYSNDCLFVCKEQLREYVSSSSLDIVCDDIFNALRKPIDVTKFKKWFDSNLNNFKSKQNIKTYFDKSFWKEYGDGRFNLVEKSIDFTSLVQALRDKGIKVTSDDTITIDVLWRHILRQDISVEEAVDINHKVVEYMKSGQSFSDYLNNIKKSKILKDHNVELNWEAINAEVLEISNEWEATLDKLSFGGVPND